MYLYVYNYIVCTLRQKIKLNCHSKTWSVLNLLSEGEVWHRNRLLNVSRSALWCSFSYVSYLGTAESWQGVSPHHQVPSRNCAATPETQQQYVHLVIQSEKLPQPLLMVLKPLDASGLKKAGEQALEGAPGSTAERGPGSWIWVLAAVCCVASKHPPLWSTSFTHHRDVPGWGSDECGKGKCWCIRSVCVCLTTFSVLREDLPEVKRKKNLSRCLCVCVFFSSVVGLLLFDSPVTPCYAILDLQVVLWWLPVLVSLVPAQHGDDCCLIWGLLCFSEFLLDRDVTCHWQ